MSMQAGSPFRRLLLGDLPHDVLAKIAEQLDKGDLLNLSVTCHGFQDISLQRLFALCKIGKPYDGWFVAFERPPETLPALRSCLSITQLTHAYYYFNPDVDRLFSEINDMYYLFKRMVKVEYVRLHFSVVDRWIDASQPSKTLDKEQWFRLLTRLLELIVNRSCTELHIVRGAEIKSLYSVPEPLNFEFWAQLRLYSAMDGADPTPTLKSNYTNSARRLKRSEATTLEPWSISQFFERIVRKKKHLGSLSLDRRPDEVPMASSSTGPASSKGVNTIPTTKPCLKDISIHSDMMLQPTFFNWTLSFLSNPSYTASITRLSFNCPQTTGAQWTRLLSSLLVTFHHLENFEMMSEFVVVSDGAPFRDLEAFFARHSTIKRIHLHGVQRFGLPLSDITSIEVPILPNLESFLAHPTWVIALLQIGEKDPGWLRNLKEIGISTEYYDRAEEFDYELVNTALECVAVFCHSRSNHTKSHLNSSSDKSHELTLTLRFMTKPGIFSFFNHHIVQEQKPSTVSRLTGISTFIISSAFYVELGPDTLSILPAFLDLFPHLESFEFIEQPQESAELLLKPKFIEMLAKRV